MDNEEELQERYLQLRDDYQDFQLINFRIGVCHHCHRKEVVYECFRDNKLTACKKRYCEECLEKAYKVNIARAIKRESTWLCPFKSGRCKCGTCISKDPDTEEQLLQADFIPLILETPVFEGSRAWLNELNEDPEQLWAIKGKPHREPVWQETLYENGDNQRCTIYIMRNFSHKPGRGMPVVEKIQQALQLNAYLIKMLAGPPLSEADKNQIESVLQHNLYYLSRNADYCKLKGLVSFDTKLNRVQQQSGIYNSDILSLYHFEDDIKQKVCSEYSRYLEVEQHKANQREAREQARLEEQQSRLEREMLRHEREEERFRRENEELDRREEADKLVIGQLKAQIYRLQQRKKELL